LQGIESNENSMIIQAFVEILSSDSTAPTFVSSGYSAGIQLDSTALWTFTETLTSSVRFDWNATK
jgi:hypothetical protein